jgi:hypothetical protein
VFAGERAGPLVPLNKEDGFEPVVCKVCRDQFGIPVPSESARAAPGSQAGSATSDFFDELFSLDARRAGVPFLTDFRGAPSHVNLSQVLQLS